MGLQKLVAKLNFRKRNIFGSFCTTRFYSWLKKPFLLKIRLQVKFDHAARKYNIELGYGRGGDLVVSVLAIYSDDLSSNPNDY